MTVEQALQAMAVFPESPWVHRSVANVLVGEVEQLRAEMASPDGLLSYAELRARLLKLEIENSGLKASLNHVAGERDRMAAEAAKGTRDGRD